jgi:hypothetical protein
MPSLNTGNAILSNAIAVDSSYNVGIGGAASGSFKLQVTGTSNLTGALTGTSAVFSSSVTADGQLKTTATGQSISINAAGTGSVRMQLQNNNTGNAGVIVESSTGGDQFSGTSAYSMAIGTYTARDLFLGTNSVQRFKLDASTGAATFSSSVQGNGGVYSGTGASAATIGGKAATASGLTDKDLTLSAWYPTSGTNEYGGDLYLSAGRPTGGGSGKYGTVYIQAGIGNGTSNVAGSVGTVIAANNTLLQFFTATTETASPTERMRITSGGAIKISTGAAPTSGDGMELWYNGTSSLIGSYNRTTSAYKDLYFFGLNTIFENGGSEQMRITSGGNVGIGNTGSASVRLFVKGVDTSGSNYGFIIHNSSNADLFFVRNDGLFLTGSSAASPYNLGTSGRGCIIESNGVLGYQSSTRESKINIEQLSDVSWLHQLNPVSFNYRKKDNKMNYTNEAQEEKCYGLIADEVEKVNEDLVFYNVKEDGTKQLAGVEYNKLIAVLIKSVQEQQAQIEELKQIVATK